MAGDTSSSKTQLRREFRQLRSSLSPAQRRRAAARIALRLSQAPCFRRARYVAIYLPCGSELDTAPLQRLCLAQGKQVYVPKMLEGSRMRFEHLPAGTTLRRNQHGIAEPANRRLQRTLRRMDLVVLPLTAFDLQGHRLGAGGGYYDRALAFRRSFRKPWLVGYAYALQQAVALPAESWDVRLDAVVTERRLHLFRP
ncbi:MAG TPA: 5-formyltetrahydrofolate cyclo-ligase [Solimonas sp.]|nr:5-formyltetrahydrofolate cyclo-ligase [Solimonas sp.]